MKGYQSDYCGNLGIRFRLSLRLLISPSFPPPLIKFKTAWPF